MFWPNYKAIFRLISEEVECSMDSVFNLRDIAFQELVKMNVVYFIKVHR